MLLPLAAELLRSGDLPPEKSPPCSLVYSGESALEAYLTEAAGAAAADFEARSLGILLLLPCRLSQHHAFPGNFHFLSLGNLVSLVKQKILFLQHIFVMPW